MLDLCFAVLHSHWAYVWTNVCFMLEYYSGLMLGEKGDIFMGSYYRLQPDLCLGLCRIFAWIYDRVMLVFVLDLCLEFCLVSCLDLCWPYAWTYAGFMLGLMFAQNFRS